MLKTHDAEIAEVMSELAEFYYPSARFISFPPFEIEGRDGAVIHVPGAVLDTRGAGIGGGK